MQSLAVLIGDDGIKIAALVFESFIGLTSDVFANNPIFGAEPAHRVKDMHPAIVKNRRLAFSDRPSHERVKLTLGN